MKRILNIMLALILCFTMNITAFAAENTYVFDDAELITTASEEKLNDKGAEIQDSTGIIVSYLVTNYKGDEVAKYAREYYTDKYGKKDGILLCETETKWFIYKSGKAERIFTDSYDNALWDACSSAQYYSEGAEAYMNKAYEILKAKGVVKETKETQPVQTTQPAESTEITAGTDSDHPARLVDDGELLSQEEEASLIKKLDKISEKQNVDVAIVTVKSLDGKEAQAYADDYFDYNGYGMGEGDDGILLLVSIGDRQSAMSTYGFGLTAFTIAGMDYIWDQITPYMSEEQSDFASAFNEFATLCDDYITQAKTGEPYDTGNMPDDIEMTWSVALRVLLISMLLGAILGFFRMKRKKKKLSKTVAKNENAIIYKNHMEITEEYDKCIYRNKYKIYHKDNDSSSSGGSGSGAHVSSSGRVHGGSSRGF